MKTVGIVNFHLSKNYGSALLAYAMQRAVDSLGFDCKIINYQPRKQKACYQLPMLVSRHSAKRFIERLCWGRMNQQMKRKYERFDNFMRDYTRLTPYCDAPDKINDVCGTFNYYIAGGDQIWNTRCAEFEWYYYLNFVVEGRKVAYAPSMGPGGGGDIPAEQTQRVRDEVNSFDAVAVRDSATAAFFSPQPPTVLDPTMLLTAADWAALAGDRPIIAGDYVLYYDPFDMPNGRSAARRYAREHGCKIVSTNIYMIFKKDSRTFDYRLDIGPLEFLNIISHARYCIGRSFHLCVFALLFEKECRIVDGLHDCRTAELVNKLLGGADNLSGDGTTDLIITATDYTPKFHQALERERSASLRFLAQALGA